MKSEPHCHADENVLMDNPLVRSLSEAFFQTLSSDQVSVPIPLRCLPQFSLPCYGAYACRYMQRVRKNAEDNIRAASGQPGFALSVLQVLSLPQLLKRMPEAEIRKLRMLMAYATNI